MLQKLTPLFLCATLLKAFTSAKDIISEEAPNIVCLKDDAATRCVDPWDHRQCIPGSAQKSAITFAFDQYTPWEFNSTWYMRMKKAAEMSKADLILLLPAKDAPEDPAEIKDDCNVWSEMLGACSKGRVEIPDAEMQEIEKYFKVVRVPWVVPPGLSKSVPRDGGCCGAREFMRLHAIGLEDYDAVINLDAEIAVYGSLQPLFQCAASGKFLTARGSTSGVHSSMFLTKPSKSLLYDLLIELMNSTVSDKGGWNGRRLAPGTEIGSRGLEGFLYHYFYQRGPADEAIQAGQLNPCKWIGPSYCRAEDCYFTPMRHGIRCPENMTGTEHLVAGRPRY